MSHLKNNYIFGILESRPTIWHTFKQISSTFNFWPSYNPMGSFWSPVFQNVQWCQSGISLFACQDMSKSQIQQKYCNYTRLPSPKFILLFVNSTMCACKLVCYLCKILMIIHLFTKIQELSATPVAASCQVTPSAAQRWRVRVTRYVWQHCLIAMKMVI